MQREAIRAELARANTAAFVILIVVLGLAIAAIVQSWRADREAGFAGEASHDAQAMRQAAQDRRRRAHLEQARRLRQTGEPGRRVKALEALKAAAAIRPDQELRNEWIAAVVWDDLRESAGRLPFHTPTFNVGWNRSLQQCALAWNDVHVFDLSAKQELHRLTGARGAVGWLRFSPDGRWLSARHHTQDFVWWELATGRVAGRWSAPHSMVPDSASDFSPDRRLLAVSGSQMDIRLFDAESGRPVKSLASPRHHRSLRFAPDGRRLAVSASSLLELWDWERGVRAAAVTNSTEANWIAWHPAGRWLAFAGQDGTIGFWDWRGGRTWRWEGHDTATQEIHLSPDGTRLVSWSFDNTLIEWDVATGQPLMRLEHMRGHHFSPDGRRLSFERPLKEVGLWENVRSEEHRAIIAPAAPFHAFDLNPDGTQLLAASDGELRLYDVKAGSERAVVNAPGAQHVWFASDGQTLCTIDGRTQTTWQLKREEALAGGESWRLNEQQKSALPVEGAEATAAIRTAVAPDGTRLNAILTNNVVRLLDARDGTPLADLTPPRPAPLRQVRVSHNGSTVAALTEAGHILLWNLQAIRQQLAALNLDFHQTSPAISTATVSAPDKGSSWYTQVLSWSALGGVLLATVLAMFVRRRQQRLLASYLSIDALVARRNEQLAQAQTELLHSEKMRALGTLAAGIAHDFNNLLSIIRMSNRLIAREAEANREIQENTAEIEQAVEQGKAVVRAMLGYSREVPDDDKPCPVAEGVEAVVGLLSKQFLSGITLTLELAPDAPPVTVPRGRIEQILLNLLVNASEAMAGQGKLMIQLRPRLLEGPFVLNPRPAAAYVELVVADSGPGIQPDALPRIFEPFFTTKTVGAVRGTGLGLSMVYTIAQREGLGIAVESAVGQGTTFRILIPVGQQP